MFYNKGSIFKRIDKESEHFRAEMDLDIIKATFSCCCCSVGSDTLWPHKLQQARLPCPSLALRVCTNSCPLTQWCHQTISSSIIPFSSCLQSFPASGSFPMSQFFASGGLRIGAPALASVLPMNIQGWFPLGLTGLMSLQSKGLLRVFSNSTVQKHQFFGTQPSRKSSSHGSGQRVWCENPAPTFNCPCRAQWPWSPCPTSQSLSSFLW